MITVQHNFLASAMLDNLFLLSATICAWLCTVIGEQQQILLPIQSEPVTTVA
jgi:hypothetical protein